MACRNVSARPRNHGSHRAPTARRGPRNGISPWPDAGKPLTISRFVDPCEPVFRRRHCLLSALSTAVAQEPCVTLDLSDALEHPRGVGRDAPGTHRQAPAGGRPTRPRHPYTATLVAAATPPGRMPPWTLPIIGEVPHGLDIPSGCAFHPRCPYVQPTCRTLTPALATVAAQRQVACHLYTDATSADTWPPPLPPTAA